ncbi:hypothetical protein ACFL24_00540 [Patescibacteria group bacterium]
MYSAKDYYIRGNIKFKELEPREKVKVCLVFPFAFVGMVVVGFGSWIAVGILAVLETQLGIIAAIWALIKNRWPKYGWFLTEKVYNFAKVNFNFTDI